MWNARDVTGSRENARVSASRRGRPTLRALRDDLGIDIDARSLDALSPLSSVDHPIVRKAAESFGADPGDDHHEGPVRSSTTVRLLEIRMSQWRGGIWIDDATGQPWLVTAGLAKGGHRDRDDFYKNVERAEATGATAGWLPTDLDRQQLRRERAASLMIDWELRLQELSGRALGSAIDGGAAHFSIPHPKPHENAIGAATLTLEPGPDSGSPEELLVEIDLIDQHKGSNIGWQATLRILTTLDPRQVAWDRGGGIFSPAPGGVEFGTRVDQVLDMVARRDLADSIPNDRAHFTHRRSLTEATVIGRGVRALCGSYFVPTQDHEALLRCDVCDERFAALP